MIIYKNTLFPYSEGAVMTIWDAALGQGKRKGKGLDELKIIFHCQMIYPFSRRNMNAQPSSVRVSDTGVCVVFHRGQRSLFTEHTGV